MKNRRNEKEFWGHQNTEEKNNPFKKETKCGIFVMCHTVSGWIDAMEESYGMGKFCQKDSIYIANCFRESSKCLPRAVKIRTLI